jgi:antirestriction protein ArdC
MEPTTQSTVEIDVCTLVTNRIIELLEQGTVPWQKPWTEAGFPRNLITKRQYRGTNLLLLQSLGYSQNLFLTWEQLKAVGGSVNKGQRAHLVVFWKPLVRQKTSPEFVLKYYKVFNVAQCRDIPQYLFDPPLHTGYDPLVECEHIIEHMPSCPKVVHKKQKAFYNTENDIINMPLKGSFTSIESYYCTLFHELVHSTGHKSRLNRDTMSEMSEFGAELYSEEELIAEFGAMYLCSHGKILTAEIANSAAYINGWLTKLRGDKQFIVTATVQAQKAVEYILKVKEDSEELPNRA